MTFCRIEELNSLINQYAAEGVKIAQEYENIQGQENISAAVVNLSMDRDSVFVKDTQETPTQVSSIPDAGWLFPPDPNSK